MFIYVKQKERCATKEDVRMFRYLDIYRVNYVFPCVRHSVANSPRHSSAFPAGRLPMCIE